MVMHYLVIETFKAGRKADVYSRYRLKGRMLPEGLEYVSSWLEVDGNRCFQIMKTANFALFDVWMSNWNDLLDFEVVAVMASPTAHSAG